MANWKISFVVGTALLPYLVFLICRCGEVNPAPAPLFGFDAFNTLVDPSLTNSTSLLGVLALSHLQHKLDTLNALGQLFGVPSVNGTMLGR